MKAKKGNNSKKNKYLPPKIDKHDTKSLMSKWSFGIYGLLYPSCTCN
ncbi:MAG: hypothetical protein PHQ96_09360 [Candidatus Omnitrophica bacterium]|nr:hypothetical protein [Candidatus Omnitrophota bacterium]